MKFNSPKIAKIGLEIKALQNDHGILKLKRANFDKNLK